MTSSEISISGTIIAVQCSGGGQPCCVCDDEIWGKSLEIKLRLDSGSEITLSGMYCKDCGDEAMEKLQKAIQNGQIDGVT